jgi:hypothetical protein
MPSQAWSFSFTTLPLLIAPVEAQLGEQVLAVGENLEAAGAEALPRGEKPGLHRVGGGLEVQAQLRYS